MNGHRHPLALPAVRRTAAAALAVMAAALTALAGPAAADVDRRAARVPLLPAYAQECGACHVAFAPGLLPAASWQRLMGTLPRHFGTDASLDPALQQSLTAWLVAHAATGRKTGRASPPDDRITRSAWFVHEHDEIAAAVWARPSIKSAANCPACHARADQGDFDEHAVRIPR